MSRRAIILALLAGLSAAGCETTGDPNEGGYFGWSEEKAQERQQELLRQYEEEQAQLDAAQAERDRLSTNRSDLSASLEAQRQRNDYLRADIGTRSALIRSLESLDQEKRERLDALRVDVQATEAPGRDPYEVKRELDEIGRRLQEIEASLQVP